VRLQLDNADVIMVVCVWDWSEIMRGARRKMATVRCAL